MRLIVGVLALLSISQAFAKTIICIDPGHPSEVGPGTRGKFITEVEAAWKVSLELSKLLKSNGFTVVLTKSSMNQKVTNPRRAQIANASGAKLMVRLHCDHAKNDRGIATFYARRPGKIGSKRGPSASVLKQVRAMVIPFHRAFVKDLDGALRDRGLRTDSQTSVGSRYGALIGSIHSEVPSILVEMCVLSNAKDEAFLRTKSGMQRMAQAIFAGIEAALEATGS